MGPKEKIKKTVLITDEMKLREINISQNHIKKKKKLLQDKKMMNKSESQIEFLFFENESDFRKNESRKTTSIPKKSNESLKKQVRIKTSKNKK